MFDEQPFTEAYCVLGQIRALEIKIRGLPPLVSLCSTFFSWKERGSSTVRFRITGSSCLGYTFLKLPYLVNLSWFCCLVCGCEIIFSSKKCGRWRTSCTSTSLPSGISLSGSELADSSPVDL